MVRKLFVGVSVEARANTAIDRVLRSYDDIQIRWIPKENRHVTMLFLGHVDDENLPNISEGMRDVSARYAAFDLMFDTLDLGPTPERPKVVWLTAVPNNDISRLHDDLERTLFSHVRSEKKQFRPHVTLGRLSRDARKEVMRDSLSREKNVNIVVGIESITLFESVVEQGKRAYVPIDVFELVG